MKKGDFIYYYRPIDGTFETIPAKVLRVTSKRLYIEANFPEGTRNAHVSQDKCELQEDYIQAEEPELVSSCCSYPVIFADMNGHGICSNPECGENCTSVPTE